MTDETDIVGTSAPIGLGLIGLGLITQTVHLPNLARMTDLYDVVNVCDLSSRWAQKLAHRLGPRVRHSQAADELLADDRVEAVLICTPGAHSALAGRAMAAGKHVFAEKPYAYDPTVAAADARSATDAGLVLQVGYMKMYEPAITEARSAFDRIGPLHAVRMTVLHPSDARQVRGIHHEVTAPPAELVAAATAENRAEVAAALGDDPTIDPVLFRNVLHGSLCHQTAVLRALFPGEVASVAFAQRDRARRGDAGGEVPRAGEPPKLQIGGRIGDGVQWCVSWNWLTDYPEYEEYVEILGSRGQVRLDFPAPYGGSRTASSTVKRSTPDGVEVRTWRPDGPSAFELELRAFWESVRQGAPVLSDARGAAQDARLLKSIGAAIGHG